MDKAELKKLLKPLMKECIREVLMENGLQKIISEVQVIPQKKSVIQKQTTVKENTQLTEARKKMVEEISKSSYMNNKFDPFTNTKPLTEAQAAGTPSPMSSIDPNDPGIDVGDFINSNKNVWKAIVGGKG